MRRLYTPIFIALVATLTGLAATPVLRTSATRTKVINTTGHHATLRQETMPVVMTPATADEAPADAYEVPFTHTLGKSEATNTNRYMAFDVNNDGKGWKVGGFSTYSACLGPGTSMDANDDWMISPPVHLLAGKTYTISFDEGVNTPNGTKAAIMGVYIGSAQTVESMLTTIIPAHEITTDFAGREENFTVDTDGYYYFGFHNTTTMARTAIMKIRNLSVTEASAKVDPPAAGTMAYVLAPKGELKATVTYTAPTLTVTGEPLTEISKVEIKANYTLAHTLTGIAPGESRSCEVELWNSAYNKLEAIAYTGDTPGTPCEIKDFYAGPDNPLPVENPTITLSDDYTHVTVSWDPVGETGERGGYVDPSKVTYYIFDAFGSYYDPALAQTTETSYTFDLSDIEGQDFVAYQITAGIDETWYSLEATTDIVTVGRPESTPFGESFANAYYSQLWAIEPGTTSSDILCGTVYDNELQTNADDESAEPEYLNSQDGDNGFFYIMPMAKDARYGFFSTKIDISGLSAPVMEFWYQGKGSAIDANIAVDGGAFQTVNTIDLKQAPTDDWTLCRIDLARFKTSRYIQIGLRLRAIHNDEEYTWSVPLDNIRVRDLVPTDLRVVTVTSTDKVNAGEKVSVSARIENLGTTACTGAQAALYRNGKQVQMCDIPAMAPDGFATVDFQEPTSVLDDGTLDFKVEISATGDAVTSNNSAGSTTSVILPVYPTAANLAAATDGGTVTLTWTAPDLTECTSPVKVTEDFENPAYEPLTISDFGGWTLYDGDKKKTYNILRETANPYQTQPQAFQLFNPVKAGVPDNYMIDIQPHSGQQLLVAWSAQGLNDNWLISPALSGNAQTISFFAKSFTIAYPETFEVLYSTTGKDMADFTKIENVTNYPADGNVAEDWTEYSAELPAGAAYFAIRHTADDTYALYIDDITFEAAPTVPADLTLTGYNIYRDGNLINTVPVTGTTTTDRPGSKGKFSYRVSAVYNHGESKACEAVTADVVTSGITAPASLTDTAITTDGKSVTIAAADDETRQIMIAGIDGRIYYSSAASGTVTVPLPKGTYLVKAGAVTAKIIL